jgi:hypothetical protein
MPVTTAQHDSRKVADWRGDMPGRKLVLIIGERALRPGGPSMVRACPGQPDRQPNASRAAGS